MSKRTAFEALCEMRTAAMKAYRTPRRWEANEAFVDALRQEFVLNDPFKSVPEQWFGIPFVVVPSDSDDPRCDLIVDEEKTA